LATKTLGTLLTTTLTALQFQRGGMAAADVAAIANSILDDFAAAGGNGTQTFGAGTLGGASKIWPGAFSSNGLLYVPNRGVLQMQPGDWVAVNAEGFPILVPFSSLPATLTATGNTHTSSLIDNLSINVLSLGWRPGMLIASSAADIPAATFIETIAANGLSLTLTKAATGTNVADTLTVSDFTHS
jgi:hypothetical protein